MKLFKQITCAVLTLCLCAGLLLIPSAPVSAATAVIVAHTAGAAGGILTALALVALGGGIVARRVLWFASTATRRPFSFGK